MNLVHLAERVADIASRAKERPRNSELINNLYRHLLDCYRYLCHPSRNQWPSDGSWFHAPDKYIDLSLYETSLVTSDVERLMNSQTSSDQYKKVRMLTDILSSASDNDERLMVLFEGVAGSGKTTLSWYACREWAEERLLQQFHLLIHIPVSFPIVQEATHLQDLIPCDDSKLREAIASAIVDRKGRGICFLLDGLDEAPASCGFLNLFQKNDRWPSSHAASSP